MDERSRSSTTDLAVSERCSFGAVPGVAPPGVVPAGVDGLPAAENGWLARDGGFVGVVSGLPGKGVGQLGCGSGNFAIGPDGLIAGTEPVARGSVFGSPATGAVWGSEPAGIRSTWTAAVADVASRAWPFSCGVRPTPGGLGLTGLVWATAGGIFSPGDKRNNARHATPRPMAAPTSVGIIGKPVREDGGDWACAASGGTGGEPAVPGDADRPTGGGGPIGTAPSGDAGGGAGPGCTGAAAAVARSRDVNCWS